MAGGSIRQVTGSDLPRLARLVAACGFPERSAEGWRWVLFCNPAQGDIPPGWVFEGAGGELAGFLGNYVITYRQGGRRFRFAVGHTAVSDLDGPKRHAGLRLLRHGVKQAGVDAYVTLNNNALSAPIFPRLGASAWLGAEGREWIEWPTGLPRILSARLARLVLRGDAKAERFRHAADPGFDRPTDLGGGIEAVPVTAQTDALVLDLARGLASEQDRIVREITPDLLAHRRADPDRAGGVWQVIVTVDGQPVLLAGLLVTKPSAQGLEHIEIADWLACAGEAGDRAQAALLRHVVSAARRAGIAKVRMHFPGLTGARLRAGTGLRTRRRLGHDPCHGIFHAGAVAESWRAGPGDADYFFSARIPPDLYRGQPAS